MSVPMREELHGPSVSVAALFKAVRSEPEGVLTLVQLLEAVRIPRGQLGVQAVAVVILHAGDLLDVELELRGYMTSPSGLVVSRVLEQQVHFTTETASTVLIADPFWFQVDEPGWHWFEVVLQGRTLARHPVRVEYAS
jgi:hypothetical protein